MEQINRLCVLAEASQILEQAKAENETEAIIKLLQKILASRCAIAKAPRYYSYDYTPTTAGVPKHWPDAPEVWRS